MKSKLFICLFILAFCNINFAQTEIPHIWYGDTILYVMPENSANHVEWGGYGTDITIGNAAANRMNGQLNTSSIVEQLGNNGGVPYAAKFCDTLTAFGYSDWYLPAHFELFRICQKADSIGNFYVNDGYIYWNSTQSLGMLPNQAGIQMFGICEASSDYKNTLLHCRCIRREYPSKIKTDQNGDNIEFFQDKSSKKINISISDKYEEIRIQIYDMNGKIVLSDKMSPSAADNIKPISYIGFGSGTYVLKLTGESFERTYKFIVE